MVLQQNAADEMDGEKDKQEHLGPLFDELQTRRERLAQIIKRKMALPRMQYIDNIFIVCTPVLNGFF